MKRAAKELAGTRDAGVRLEIPQSMQPSLKALESVSFHLKQKYPGMRRNIKFNDQEMPWYWISILIRKGMEPGGRSRVHRRRS